MRITRYGFSFLLLLVFSTASFADELKPELKTEIKIGAIFPLTGPTARIGSINRVGALIASEMVNETGGINGTPLRVIIEDSRSEQMTGVAAYRKLTEADKVPVILATLTSVIMATRPLAERDQVLILAEATHPFITTGYKYVLRNFFTGATANDGLLSLIKTHGFNRVGVLHTEDDFGEQAFEDLKAKAQDFSIVAAQSFKTTDYDLRAQILRIQRELPDLVYVIGVGPVVAIAYEQLHQLKVNSKFAGFVLCGQDDLIPAAKGAMDGSFSIEPVLDENSEFFQELRHRVAKTYPGTVMNQSFVTGFDGVMRVAEALRSGARSGSEIRRYFVSHELKGLGQSVKFNESGDAPVKTHLMRVQGTQCVPEPS